MPTGMTGIWPAAQGHLADPSASAWRMIPTPPQNGLEYSAGFTVSGMSATGSGTIMDSRAFPRGAMYMRISGNSASAEVLCSHDPDSNIWVQVAGYYTGVASGNCDALVALEQHYSYLRGRVSFVSADAGVTASVWMYFNRTPA